MLNSRYSLASEISRQQALEAQIAQLQIDISSGIKVHVASDDPQAAARIAQIGRQQANEATYASNVKQAQATASLLDSNLDSVQTALVQAKTAMLQGSNGSANASDRQALVTELQGIQKSLQNLSNQTDSSGNPLYVQNGQPPLIPIGNGNNVAAADSYTAVFGSVTLKSGSVTDINTILTNAINALQSGNQAQMSTSLDDLDSAASHISDMQADIGVRENQLNDASDALANSATNLKTERSGLEDTDATEAYATMSSKMTVLNAAQAVLTTIGKNSLFDKIS